MPVLTDFWQRYGITEQGTARVLNQTAIMQPEIGMLDAIASTENRQGFEQDFTTLTGGGLGKKKKAMYKYNTRGLVADTLDEADAALNYCTPSRTNAFLQNEIEVERYEARQFFIGNEYIRLFDETAQQHFNSQIMLEATALVQSLNRKLITLFEAGRGNTSAGNTTVLTAQAFTAAATYTTNIAFQESIRQEFRKLNHSGRLMMVADGLAESYANILSLSTVNQAGQNVSITPFTNRFAFYGDATLDATIDNLLVENNNALVWVPGTFQMLQWYQNRGDFRKVSSDEVTDVIALNINGVRHVFDIFIRYSNCTDTGSGMHITLKKWYDVWNYPTDAFKVGDPLNGVNFLERWRATAP